jgi:phage tail protein X
LTADTLNALKQTFSKLYREGATVGEQTVKSNKTIAAIGKLLPDALALRLMKSQVQKFRRAD